MQQDIKLEFIRLESLKTNTNSFLFLIVLFKKAINVGKTIFFLFNLGFILTTLKLYMRIFLN